MGNGTGMLHPDFAFKLLNCALCAKRGAPLCFLVSGEIIPTRLQNDAPSSVFHFLQQAIFPLRLRKLHVDYALIVVISRNSRVAVYAHQAALFSAQ